MEERTLRAKTEPVISKKLVGLYMYMVCCTLGYHTCNHKGQLSYNNLYIQILFLIYVQNVLINYINLWLNYIFFIHQLRALGGIYIRKNNIMIITMNEICNTGTLYVLLWNFISIYTLQSSILLIFALNFKGVL